MTDRIIWKIQELLETKTNVIISLDGRCGAGKTTLAKRISEVFDCNVIHMDDFFLRPEQRSEERLAQAGGNVDYERFFAEVLSPMSLTGGCTYRPYCCRTQSYCEEIYVEAKKLAVVEGSYSSHPFLRKYYDICVFVDVGKELQKQRISERNPDNAQMFFEKWIPLEEKYFEEFKVRENADIIVEEL